MNRIIILIVAITLVACSKQELTEKVPSKPSKQVIKLGTRSYDEALKIAENAIGILENTKSTTRGNEKSRKIDLSESKVIMRDSQTRGVSDCIDTLIYVFNFENDEGFALVSASKGTEELLAITEIGHCDPKERSEVGGFEMFKEMAKDYVYKASIKLRIPDGPYVETRDSITYSSSTVGPYVSVRWGQFYPEGEYCPNGIAGCTNTAIAQIMSYYNYPTSIDLTYSGADVNTQSLNWADMKTHTTGHNLSSCGISETHKAVCRLLREIGERDSSMYLPSYTSTTDYYPPFTLSSLGYTCGGWSTYNGNLIRLQLNISHLYLVSGDEGNMGHSWVLDGYMNQTATIRQMARTATSGWFFTGVVNYETTYYLHFNWGWYGNCNGYFSEGVYNTAGAFQYDILQNATHNYSNINFLSVYH